MKCRFHIFFFFLAVFILFALPTASFAYPLTNEGILKLINAERADAGLAPLFPNTTLVSAANERANDMAEEGYFSHTSSDGKIFLDGLRKNGYTFSKAGENIAFDFRHDENVVATWMKSEGHKRNILNPDFTETGIGIASGEKNGETVFVAVQIFASRGEKTILPSAVSFTDASGKNRILGLYASPISKMAFAGIIAGFFLMIFFGKKIFTKFLKH